MFCPTCGNESTQDEVKFCNRCGGTLSLPTQIVTTQPIKLTIPSIVLGLTVMIGLGMIMAGVGQMALVGMPPGAIAAIAVFCAATLFGCVAMMIQFWTKLMAHQQSISTAPQPASVQRPTSVPKPTIQQLPPRLEPVPSVTEQTTRNFSPVYTDSSDRGTKEY